ncbi:MAG: DUF58 domain-containing protein, partial [Actinomycetes bacterium]
MTTEPLEFAATARPRRLAMVAVLAVVAAVVTAHGELLVVAAGPLVLLVLAPRSGLPRAAQVALSLDPRRCVEDDEVSLTVSVAVPGADRVELAVGWRAHIDVVPAQMRGGTGTAEARWTLLPRRWGRYRDGDLSVRVVAGHGMYAAALTLPLGELVVYPGSGVLARPVAPRELPARGGEHPSRAVGAGLEYAGVRPYVTGDRRRDIDWRSSARHGDLFVRQYAADRSVDLVVVIDVGVDAGEPGRSTLDLTVRAATGLATTYLRVADRVGLVTLGGSVRWLTPAGGVRQLHRIADAVMQVRLDDSQVGGGIDRVPAAALPRGAFVCVLSPLLDDRALEAVRDLRARGFGLLVVDVLTTEPALPHRPRRA